MRTAYRCRAYPDQAQQQVLARTFGCIRVVWNRTLAERHRLYHADGKSLSYAASDAALTAMKKDPDLAFLSEVSSVPLQQALRHQHKAFRAFFDKRVRYPRFKSRRSRQSAHYTRSAFAMRGGELRLAKTNARLRFVWSWPDVDVTSLNPTMVVVSREPDGRWYVTFAIDTDAPEPLEPAGHAVGVDLGVKDFAVTSDGQRIANPRHLERKAANLARYQRRLARCRKGSANRAKARAKVARTHRKVRDARRDFLHRASTCLVRGNDVIVIDRWFPSSRTCSACGHLLGELSLSTRHWTCPSCGSRHDRDINAAKNILAAGQAVTACGAGVRHAGTSRVRPAVKQEPSRRRLESPSSGRGVVKNLRSQYGAPRHEASPWARRPRRIATILTFHQACPDNRKEAGSADLSIALISGLRSSSPTGHGAAPTVTGGGNARPAREHAAPARRCGETEGVAVDLRLDGKVAVVTGASKGIGRCVADFLAREGCNLVITARTATPLEAAAEKIAADTGRAVLPLAGDMSVAEDVRRCVDATLEQFGHIDILVTCAGSSPGGLLEDLTEEQWMSSLNLKFMGYVRSVRAVIGHMRERGEGAIVLVVGNDGLKPSYWEMTAGVANAADINFASSVAEQYGRHGVRINTVNPGPVNTDRWDTLEKAFARDKGVSQERAHELAEQSIPFGRICEPEEVAALVTFLASPRASFINGAHIPVDGAQRKAIMDQ